MDVGIEALRAYIPQYAVRLTDLACARGVPPEKLTEGLGVREMAIAPPWEDVVTLAATAGAQLVRSSGIDPDAIGMLVVATETGIDHSKPVGIIVHDLLGIGPHCRVWETKHACYAGTAALMCAADWVRAGATRERRALVIAADIARYEIGSPGEPTQGAGAVAMLIGPEPRALVLGEETGTYAKNVYDFWRPLARREAIVDGKFSVACYLDALAAAFGAYRRLERPTLGATEALSDRLARLLYHTPFPKMAMKAHRRLLELDWHAADRWREVEPQLEAVAGASYQRQVAPTLTAAACVGNTYTASLYLCLAALLERERGGLAGERLGLFSYGSGCCAEYFTGLVPREAPRDLDTGVAAMLADRTFMDIDQYERFMRHDGAGAEPPPGFRGEFAFTEVHQERRRYVRAGCDGGDRVSVAS